MESIFIYHSDYTIEPVKTKSVFKPLVWRKAFNESLKKHIIEAKIIHTYLGLKIPLKTYSRSQEMQVIEFAGLHGYNERSKYLLQHLHELESQLYDTRLTRVDVAIDWVKIPVKVLKALKANREPFKWLNSTYYKTAKEGKKNYYINVVAYDKAKKENLSEPMERL